MGPHKWNEFKKTKLLKLCKADYFREEAKFKTPNFISKIHKAFNDTSLTNSINRTIKEFREAEANEHLNSFHCVDNDIGKVGVVCIETIILHDTTPSNLDDKSPTLGRPHIFNTNPKVRKLYVLYANLYARIFKYLTRVKLHRLLRAEGIQISLTSVTRHLKQDLKAETKNVVFQWKLLSENMPLIPTPIIDRLEPWHPNHKDHPQNYKLWLHSCDKILYWDEIDRKGDKMDEKFIKYHVRWNLTHKLNGNPEDYQFRPLYCSGVYDPPRIVKTKKQVRQLQKEFKPFVS